MSDRKDILYLTDIIDSINAISSYTDNLTLESFVLDRKSFQATIREFEVIGEAINHLDPDITAKHPDIKWRDIVDFRNLLIHEYFGVDAELVWNVIMDDLPTLKSVVVNLFTEYSS